MMIIKEYDNEKFEENLIIFVSEADVFIVTAPKQGWKKNKNGCNFA